VDVFVSVGDKATRTSWGGASAVELANVIQRSPNFK